MSKFTVNLEDKPQPQINAAPKVNAPAFGDYQQPKKKSGCLKYAGIFAGILAVVALVAAVGGYFYWQSLKKTPQYSLALLVEAARRDDQKTVDSLVDTDAVVDDFMPQITDKAVELYGKGLPPQALSKIAQIAAPVLPAVKERARAELPNLIRDKTDKLANVPFAAIVIGSGRYLNIKQEGETATITSKIPDRQFELRMKRNGNVWQLIGVKDDRLATKIAQKIGQEIIAAATKGGINNGGDTFGVKNLQDLLKKANELLK